MDLRDHAAEYLHLGVWEDGAEELVRGHVIAWTRRAVRVRFGVPPESARGVGLGGSSRAELNALRLGLSEIGDRSQRLLDDRWSPQMNF